MVFSPPQVLNYVTTRRYRTVILRRNRWNSLCKQTKQRDDPNDLARSCFHSLMSWSISVFGFIRLLCIFALWHLDHRGGHSFSINQSFSLIAHEVMLQAVQLVFTINNHVALHPFPRTTSFGPSASSPRGTILESRFILTHWVGSP